MKSELIEVLGENEQILTRGRFYPGSKTPENLVIAQVWLGATIDKPDWFISDLCENADRYWDYSVAAIEHPGHGLNINPNKKTIWTLQDCEEATLWAIHQILEDKKPEKVILAGNSLGFWTLYNALAKCHGINPTILALLGKSGIVSYRAILGQLLARYWSSQDWQKAWQKLMEDLKMGKDGWGVIQINPQDPPIPIHRNLLETICTLNERDSTDTLVECWHGDRDEWTNIAEMEAHNLWEITVHKQREMSHSLCHNGNDSVSREVNRAMIWRIKEIFAKGN